MKAFGNLTSFLLIVERSKVLSQDRIQIMFIQSILKRTQDNKVNKVEVASLAAVLMEMNLVRSEGIGQ